MRIGIFKIHIIITTQLLLEKKKTQKHKTQHRDGYIDFKEFVKIVEASDFGDKLTLQF